MSTLFKTIASAAFTAYESDEIDTLHRLSKSCARKAVGQHDSALVWANLYVLIDACKIAPICRRHGLIDQALKQERTINRVLTHHGL